MDREGKEGKEGVKLVSSLTVLGFMDLHLDMQDMQLEQVTY